MGNTSFRIPEQNIPVEAILTFMTDETKRWTEILKNKPKPREHTLWYSDYLVNELLTTVEHWNKKFRLVDRNKYGKGKVNVEQLMKENGRLEEQVKHLQNELTRKPITQQPSSPQVMTPTDNNKEKELEMKKTIDELKAEVASLEHDKESLMLRLSKIAGEKLVANNPNIADLSDPNRPTKIGEQYGELYDNEWTDAYEALVDAGHGEETTIETLRLTLMNVFSFCERKADMLIHKAANAVDVLFEEYKTVAISSRERHLPAHLTIRRKVSPTKPNFENILLQLRWQPSNTKGDQVNALEKSQVVSKQVEIAKIKSEAEGKLVALRKDVAISMVPLVQQAYIDASWNSECIPELKPYIRQCLFICWMMVVQSPPMSLHMVDVGTKFDKSHFKEYRASGRIVEYVVWPCMLLHKEGPVVCKGVAQGMPDKVAARASPVSHDK